jgi:sortase A
MRRAVPGLLIVLGAVQLAQGSWIHAKAVLAQVLLERSWQRTVAGESAAAPWPWADTWPVARLRIPAHEADLIVLEGASGRVMAFAPGRLHGSARPGEPGACVIAGHRDTHFAVLEDLSPGAALVLEDGGGQIHRYRVEAAAVVDHRDAGALECHGSDRCLVLITCWPFDAVRPGGPLRYVVWAEAVPESPRLRRARARARDRVRVRGGDCDRPPPGDSLAIERDPSLRSG